MTNESLFRIIFTQKDVVQELYAKQLSESDMYGFIVVEEIVFGERSSVLVDPAEEKVKQEFAGVLRTYIPMHTVIRIDEIEQKDAVGIKSGATNNISIFPQQNVNKT